MSRMFRNFFKRMIWAWKMSIFIMGLMTLFFWIFLILSLLNDDDLINDWDEYWFEEYARLDSEIKEIKNENI